MKKIFDFRNKRTTPLEGSNGPQKTSQGTGSQSKSTEHLHQPRCTPIGKIHKAARVGHIKKVQHLLMFGKNHVNDRDQKNRTALHYACTYGHKELANVLITQKCEIDARDKDNRTPLIKASQHKQEECVAMLLDNGADPNIMDSHGNTALHYSVQKESISIAGKLIAHKAHIESQNKDGVTPLLLALMEDKRKIANFLLKMNIREMNNMANHTETECEYEEQITSISSYTNAEMKSEKEEKRLDDSKNNLLQLCGRRSPCSETTGVISQAVLTTENHEDNLIEFPLLQKENKEEISELSVKKELNTTEADFLESKRQMLLEQEEKGLNINQASNPVNESFDYDTLTRFSDLPEHNCPWPTSDEDDFNFDVKKSPELDLKKQWKAFKKSRNIKGNCGFPWSDDMDSMNENEDAAETLKTSVNIQKDSHPSISSPYPKEGKKERAIGNKKNDMIPAVGLTKEEDEDSPWDSEEETIEPAVGKEKNDMTSVVGLRKEEDEDSPWDSESLSENLPFICVGLESVHTYQEGKYTVNGLVEESPEKNLNLKEGATDLATGEEENDMTCAIEPKKKEAEDSPWDSESLSESLPFICVGLKNVLEYQEGKCTVNGTANESLEKNLILKEGTIQPAIGKGENGSAS